MLGRGSGKVSSVREGNKESLTSLTLYGGEKRKSHVLGRRIGIISRIREGIGIISPIREENRDCLTC